MKKWIAIPLVLIAVVMVLASCAEKEATTAPATILGPATTAVPTNAPVTKPAPYGEIRIATADFSYESTDPINYISFWAASMYDNLITYDSQGNYIGSVAESWSISPDGNTWTFKIRKGITFHNGDLLTAADVKFSVDRFASKESTNPWSPYLRNNLASTAVIDDYTFQYVSQHPEPPLVIPFAWTAITPKKYFESVGQDAFRKAPIGSGPWKFVEHVPETSYKMEANTEHWRQVPAYKYVLDLQVPEEAVRIAMLKRGEVDIALNIASDRLVELKNAGWKTVTVGLPTLANISFLGTWLTDGPTGDIRVRQALSYALNRQEISDTFYMGLAVPGGRWFMHPGAYGWDPAWVPDPYDLALAKKLLAEAGYPEKFADPVIKYFVSPGPGVDFATVLQSYWTAAGIQVELNVADSVVWGGMFSVRVTGKDSPAVGGIFPVIGFGSTFNNIYHSANMYKSTGVHSTGNDPKADELYTKATTELDPAKAVKYWTEFQAYAKEMWVNVGIVMIQPLVLVGPELGEFTTNMHMSLNNAFSGIQHPK